MTYTNAIRREIMKAAHASAKRQRDRFNSYAEAFAFYLGQRWIETQHFMSLMGCTGATVTVAKAFDNGGSPIWRL